MGKRRIVLSHTVDGKDQHGQRKSLLKSGGIFSRGTINAPAPIFYILLLFCFFDVKRREMAPLKQTNCFQPLSVPDLSLAPSVEAVGSKVSKPNKSPSQWAGICALGRLVLFLLLALLQLQLLLEVSGLGGDHPGQEEESDQVGKRHQSVHGVRQGPDQFNRLQCSEKDGDHEDGAV